MSGIGIQFTQRGLDHLQAVINRLQNPDFDPLLDAIGAMVLAQTEERIASEKTDPQGGAWAPLSPAYAARKRSGGGILELEGDLRDSLTFLVSGQSVEVGSNLVYAATHQFGRDEANIPARPFLGLSAENEEEINELIDTWVEGLTAL